MFILLLLLLLLLLFWLLLLCCCCCCCVVVVVVFVHHGRLSPHGTTHWTSSSSFASPPPFTICNFLKMYCEGNCTSCGDFPTPYSGDLSISPLSFILKNIFSLFSGPTNSSNFRCSNFPSLPVSSFSPLSLAIVGRSKGRTADNNELGNFSCCCCG